jgi:hypothetical protein
MPKLRPGWRTGKAATDGGDGQISSFTDKDKGKAPRRPSDNPTSHPKESPTGTIPLGPKLKPKGNI